MGRRWGSPTRVDRGRHTVARSVPVWVPGPSTHLLSFLGPSTVACPESPTPSVPVHGRRSRERARAGVGGRVVDHRDLLPGPALPVSRLPLVPRLHVSRADDRSCHAAPPIVDDRSYHVAPPITGQPTPTLSGPTLCLWCGPRSLVCPEESRRTVASPLTRADPGPPRTAEAGVGVGQGPGTPTPVHHSDTAWGPLEPGRTGAAGVVREGCRSRGRRAWVQECCVCK